MGEAEGLSAGSQGLECCSGTPKPEAQPPRMQRRPSLAEASVSSGLSITLSASAERDSFIFSMLEAYRRGLQS